MSTETVSKPHYEIGQPVHFHWFAEFHERALTADDCAVVLNAGGSVCDRPGCVEDIVYNMDTAITAIQAGCVAVALNPEDQPALDHERELYVDCFGG